MNTGTPNIIPPDLQTVFETLQSLQTSNPVAYRAIVRPNNPPRGIGGFLFDIPDEDEIRLRSQATNYFLEDNTSVQDNIAIEPAIITLRGVVAELVLTALINPPTNSSGTVNPLVPAMMPGMTPQQSQNYAIAQQQKAQATAVASGTSAGKGTSQSLYNYFVKNFITEAGSPNATDRQTNAFLYFQQLQAGQQLVSVETPWGIYEQCAIIEVRAMQGASSKYSTNFSITFQEMRFSGEATVNTANSAGRTTLQLQPTTQNGNAGQTTIPNKVSAAGIGIPTGSPTGGGGN